MHDLVAVPLRFAAKAGLRLTCLVPWVAGIVFSGSAWGQSPQRRVDFGRDIQPLLAKRCFACHGPDKGEGGLRLNQRDTALAELDSGEHAVVPGEPDQSELLRRITAEDAGERMPPEGKPLEAEQVALVRQWIAEGAKWEAHWAFQPLTQPPVPDVASRDWVRNPIDAFILSRLEQSGLRPAPPADRAALARRAYYDLTGLPPTPAEIDDFLADQSPDAYERLVERLLASPQYGERWARHWLDAVRYAETNSFERDGAKPHAWRYRDYVIRSFNGDKPYDQFIREQLAGDEMSPGSTEGLIATGFYRLGLWDDEPADRLQAQFDSLDDLVTTTGQVFLGLTVNCARCHDHKIDPIPQRDYYRLAAFFHGIKPMTTVGPNIEQPLFASEAERLAYERSLREREERRNELQAQVTALQTEFIAAYSKSRQSKELALTDIDDLEYRFYRDHWERLPDFDQIKPETVGTLDGGRFDISLATRESDFGFVFTGMLKVPADGQYTFTVDSDDGTRLLLAGQTILHYDGIHSVGHPQQATVLLKQGLTPIRLEYFQAEGGRGLSVSWSGPSFESRSLSDEGTPRLREREFPKLVRSKAAELLGEPWYVHYQELVGELQRLKREAPPAEYALCVTEVPDPPPTFVLLRGNAHVPGEKVEPGFPSVVSSGSPTLPADSAGRTTSGRRSVLADWIASPDNRLTARVMVNRIWQHHFGRGIVRSPNNFGYLGDRPTHPELLDWLAGEFIDAGWHIKPLHRLIMLSSTYRMSSQAEPEVAATNVLRDPGNDLFWRFNMRRLSAEELRDSMHAVTGRLNRRLYGPSYYPKLSAEVMATQSAPGNGWGDSPPEEQARRSVYIHVKRSLITPLLADFDFPDTDASCEARFVTTQPAQALGMLNGDFAHEQAVHFAERLLREAGEERTAQVRLALRLALAHEPTTTSVARGVTLIEELEREYGLDSRRALDYYCLVLLNLNEFVYLD
jgi:mono/diheme cytochrome c family protein